MGIRESLLGSTALSPAREWRRFLTSRTFTPDRDMDVIIHAIGGGASGGVANSGGYGVALATGGGAGAYVRLHVTLKAGVTYTFMIGAGGAAVVGSTSYPTRADGNDGGDTTITGGGLAIVAGGGKKGTSRNGTSPHTTTLLNGGPGGIASGGDINRNGGRGGNVNAGSLTGNSSTYIAQATGGGAVNLLGDAECRGGDIGPVNYSTSSGMGSTGGGGIGENGFPLQNTGYYSLGGGLGSLTGAGDGVATTLIARSFMGFWDKLGPRSTSNSSASGPGAGNVGMASGPYASGEFAGSAGYAHFNSTGTSGIATYGGGSGGAAGGSTSSASSSGKGGDGAIFLEVLS